MKWMEVIEIRSVGDNRARLESQLQSLIKEVNQEAELQAIKVYKHVMLETDFSIHLYHETKEAEIGRSSLGLRLVSALKEFGLVNNNVWIERPNGS